MPITGQSMPHVQAMNQMIAFYYAEGKLIFLAGLVVKRRDKLRPKEEAEVKKQVEHLIDAQAEDVIELTSPSASVSQTRGNK